MMNKCKSFPFMSNFSSMADFERQEKSDLGWPLLQLQEEAVEFIPQVICHIKRGKENYTDTILRSRNHLQTRKGYSNWGKLSSEGRIWAVFGYNYDKFKVASFNKNKLRNSGVETSNLINVKGKSSLFQIHSRKRGRWQLGVQTSNPECARRKLLEGLGSESD